MKESQEMKKIVVIDSGLVDSTVAYIFALKGLAERIVLIDQICTRAESEVLDTQDSLSLFSARRFQCGDDDCRGADLIVITVGRPRKPGKSRLDLLEENWG